MSRNIEYRIEYRVLAVAADGDEWWVEECETEAEASNLAYDLAMLSGATYRVEALPVYGAI